MHTLLIELTDQTSGTVLAFAKLSSTLLDGCDARKLKENMTSLMLEAMQDALPDSYDINWTVTSKTGIEPSHLTTQEALDLLKQGAF